MGLEEWEKINLVFLIGKKKSGNPYSRNMTFHVWLPAAVF